MKKTPVDTGRARGNWQISIGSDNTSPIERNDPKNYGTVSQFKGEEIKKLNECKGDEKIFIVNNLPYITTLEYGGYPDPVKLGTWNKEKKEYEKRSAGGYSKQAPSGMVGVTVANIKRKIDEAIAESGWSK